MTHDEAIAILGMLGTRHVARWTNSTPRSVERRARALPVIDPALDNIVVSYGGGVNSVALCVWLSQHPELVPRVRAIVMADPGSEHLGTTVYRDVIMPDFLRAHGLPQITVIDRITEGKHRPRAWRLETLEEECLRIGSVPSVAYGYKKCSAKYKAEPQRWWIERQPWAQELWASGGKVTKTLGYDADEDRRVTKALSVDWAPQQERDRFNYLYPLHADGIDREGCEALIASAGLPPCPKSACTFCPNNKLDEWVALRRDEPEAFARAVEMSAAAKIDSPDVVGLMRCNTHGKRQLHVWAAGGYPDVKGGLEDDSPCECAL